MVPRRHPHHWLIDSLPMNGAYHAICKKCGAEREFPQEEPGWKFRLTRKPGTPSTQDVTGDAVPAQT
jgi:hypothetical protein